MKKRYFAMLLAVIMLIGMLPVSAMAATFTAVQAKANSFGYHDVRHPVEMPQSRSADPNVLSPNAVTAALPSSYSSVTAGRTTSIKNQGNDGTCWAFSATAACEAGLNASNGARTDLSTMQLVNFFYNTKVDPLGNATGDKTSNLDSSKRQQGGNHFFTMWGLAGWTNGAPESALPYTEANGKLADSSMIDNKYAYDYDIAHLQNAYIIPYATTSTSLNNIKRAVMDVGTVACSYYHNDLYYNASTGAYYCRTSSSNHAVAIVGWNDNYSRSNFGTSKPTADGAWLVKNSWGTSWGTDGDANETNSGMQGYFWISYYDRSLAYVGTMFAFDFQPADDYQYNYQYDGSCGLDGITVQSGDKVAAIYEVKGLSAEAESIEAIGVGFDSTDMTGTAYIYANPTAGKPTSGKLVASVPFTTTYAGYYTFEIPDAPVLAKGETFSVVISCNKAGTVFVDSTYNNGSWIGFTANTANDKTYVVSASGSVKNLASASQTARVKAYTKDASAPVVGNTYTVSYDANGGVNAPDAQTKDEGAALKLSTEVPTREGYDFAGWATDPDADEADYQPGDMYTADADVTLYAVWIEKPVIVEEKEINVSVKVTSATSGKGKKKTTTYTASITTDAKATTVKTVAYSLDNGTTWKAGNSFTSASEITNFQIKVTDADNDVYYFQYLNGVVTPKEAPKKAESLTVSASALTLTAGDSGKISVTTDPADASCNWTVNGASDVVSVAVSGNSFTVKALKAGEVTLTITDQVSGLSVTCKVTVKAPQVSKNVTVSATIRKENQKNGSKKVTVYNVTIKASATGTTVQSVQYSLDNGATWQEGKTFTTSAKPSTFLICVVDEDGVNYNFKYANGVVTKI